jgi:myosin heavy subunit
MEMYHERRSTAPHIFSTAENSYLSMLQNACNQSILINGESGAGKTEATKGIIKYLTYVSSNTGTKFHRKLMKIKKFY